MVRIGKAGALLTAVAVLASGLARAQVSPLAGGITAADSNCNASHFTTYAQLTICQNDGERTIWQTYAPEALPYYDVYAGSRLNIVTQVDAGNITRDSGSTQIAAAAALFLAQVRMLAAQETGQRQREAVHTQQRAAESRARTEQFYRTLGAGLMAYGQARAAGDAAALSAIRANPLPKTQHTTCNTNPISGTLECYTTSC